MNRRTAMKAAVGAAAAGVVWSAPRVEGLSLRPAYAAAASTPPGGFLWSGGASPSVSEPVLGLTSLACVNSANLFHRSSFFSLRIAGTGLSNCSATILSGGSATGSTITSTLLTYTGPATSVTGIMLTGTFTCT